MPPRLPLSRGDLLQGLLERNEANASTEALASDNGPSSNSDQLSNVDLTLFVPDDLESNLLPDFTDHYIPPLDIYPPPRSSSHCIMNSFTSTTTSGRRFAVGPNEYTLPNALMHTLPASIMSPPVLFPGEQIGDYGRYQHDEYYAFSPSRRARGPPFNDTPMSDLPYMTPRDEGLDSDPAHRRTYRPGDATSRDPPPPYRSANARRANRIWRDEARLQQRRQGMNDYEVPAYLDAYRVDHGNRGKSSVMKTISKSLVGCFAGVGKTAKKMRQRNRVKRARGKIAWLERHDFMSAQDRLLTQELRREGQFQARFGGPWCRSGCTLTFG